MKIDLKNLLGNEELSRKEKVLLILLSKEHEMQVREIKENAIKNGLLESRNWNFSQILSDLKGKATKLPNGWLITNQGKNAIIDLGVVEASPTKSVKPTLRKYASKISNPQVSEFAEEAISALEVGLLRSAVVLSWVGAVSILQHEVVDK